MDNDQRNEPAPESSKNRDIENAKALQAAVVACVKLSNDLPKFGNKYELYASYPGFLELMQSEKSRLVDMMRSLLKNAGCRAMLPKKLDDIERIVKANDTLIERIGSALDQHSEAMRNENIVVPTLKPGAQIVPGAKPVVRPNAVFGKDSGGRYAVLSTVPGAQATTSASFTGTHVPHMHKPQRAFKDTIDNSHAPFVPKLKVKHNAIPRKETRNLVVHDDNASGRNWESDAEVAVHPYHYEIDHFQIPDRQLEKGEVQPLKPLDEVPFVMVDTEAQLKQLIEQLNREPEFAVDLEAHNYRSFLGITCLMQITTRTTDYIVDPFPLWRSMHLLNEPFSNPNILKILHGSDSDVLWLQRDFGIYVVNLFDTYLAMRALQMVRHGLQYLVQQLCDVTLQKQYQRADWRIRPLPKDYISYARSDTHYLLHCYDVLRKKLIEANHSENNLLLEVYKEGRRLCKQHFEKPRFDPDGYRSLISARRMPNNQQLYALKQLWKWRDATARENDESLAYVLPDHMMVQIAEVLPRESHGIIACCSPVPIYVKRDLNLLHKYITIARDLPLEKTSDSDIDSVLKRTILESSSMLDANRITSLKGKLAYRMDFTAFKPDEEIPTVDSRLRASSDSQSTAIREKSEEELPAIVLQTNRAHCVKRNNFILVEDEREEKEMNDLAKKKFGQVVASIEEWASPYDCYLVQSRHQEEAAKKEAADSGASSRNASQRKSQGFSHHDAATAARPKPAANNSLSDLQISKGGKKRPHENSSLVEEDPTTLTKKALKKRRKLISKAAEVSWKPEHGGKKPKKSSGWSDAAAPEVQPVNYDAYDPNAFKAGPSKAAANAYDPMRKLQKTKKGGKVHKRGGSRGGRRGGLVR